MANPRLVRVDIRPKVTRAYWRRWRRWSVARCSSKTCLWSSTSPGGSGPVAILLHAFPESWYSWRHQLAALSEAGFHAVAPDMRGYGRTDRPEAIDQYKIGRASW